MTQDENKRLTKMEQSVEEIKTDISVIKSALIGNELSNDKGLVGDIVVVKAEIEFTLDRCGGRITKLPDELWRKDFGQL